MTKHVVVGGLLLSLATWPAVARSQPSGTVLWEALVQRRTSASKPPATRRVISRNSGVEFELEGSPWTCATSAVVAEKTEPGKDSVTLKCWAGGLSAATILTCDPQKPEVQERTLHVEEKGSGTLYVVAVMCTVFPRRPSP